VYNTTLLCCYSCVSNDYNRVISQTLAGLKKWKTGDLNSFAVKNAEKKKVINTTYVMLLLPGEVLVAGFFCRLELT
jgi:hypothetical protein